MINFKVDQETCTMCGLCVQDCIGSCLVMAGHPTMANEAACTRCQHCLAVCPVGAISILGLDPKNSMSISDDLPDLDALTTLVRGRRSCRLYQDRNVDPEILDDIVSSACHAPTGCNTHQVLFSVIASKEKMSEFRDWIMIELAKVVDKPELQTHIGMNFIKYVLAGWESKKADHLFRGAPHFAVSSVSPSSVCTQEDPLIALSYFELLATSAGLGTVWNGIATWAISDFVPEARVRLGIPSDHILGYSMSFGHPAIKYQRTVQRNPVKINYLRQLLAI